MFGTDGFHHTESIHLWHLHVKKYKIRAVFADEVNRFESVLALCYYINVACSLQKEGEFVARQLFIVDNHRGKGHRWPETTPRKYRRAARRETSGHGIGFVHP